MRIRDRVAGIVRPIAVVALIGVGGAPAAVHAAETNDPAASEQSRKPPAIRVVAAKPHEFVHRLVVNGSVVAWQEAEVGSDLSGTIVTELSADRGDSVKKGDVLARLERSALDILLAQNEAQHAQAAATISQMRAQMVDAEVAVRQSLENLERAEALQAKGFAARSQFDNAVNARDSAQARLETARRALAASEAQRALIEAQQRDIRLKLAKTEVRAPADGLVLTRNAALGELITQQTGALFRMAIGGRFELEADVAETELPQLRVGMPARVSLAGVDSVLEGKVRLIAPEIDARTRMGSVRISLPSNPHVRSGNYASGRIEIQRRTGLAVPASAVVYRGSESFLQVVTDGVVSTRAVALGIRAESRVEVKQGVQAGETVVERAGTFVTDGDQVTPIEADRMTGAISQ